MSDPALSDPDSERGGLHMGCTTANEDPYNTQALEEEERRLYEQTPATQLLPIDVYNDDSVIVIPHNTSGGTGDTMFLYTVLMVHVCQFFLHFKGGGGGGGADRKSCLHLLFSDCEPGQSVVEEEEHRPVAKKLVTDSLTSNWGECNLFQVGSHAY